MAGNIRRQFQPGSIELARSIYKKDANKQFLISGTLKRVSVFSLLNEKA